VIVVVVIVAVAAAVFESVADEILPLLCSWRIVVPGAQHIPSAEGNYFLEAVEYVVRSYISTSFHPCTTVWDGDDR
jgi:hypothetical protein